MEVVSQLYGSTTVVMAICGLHWKWQSLTPCQRHPSEPIWTIFSRIDHVIDLWFWENFQGFCFFSLFFNFFTLLGTGTSLNGWTNSHAQYLKRRRLVRGGAFSMIEKNRFLALTFKCQNPPFCSAFKILTGIISRIVRDGEMMFMEVEYALFPRLPLEVKGQGNP